jgi:hypothetical protein
MSKANVTIAELLSHVVITPGELERVLRSGKNSTSKALISGEIPSFFIGRCRKIPVSWLRAQLGIEAA